MRALADAVAILWLLFPALLVADCAGASQTSVSASMSFDEGDPLSECSYACERLKYHRCPEAVSNLGGASCVVTCVQLSRTRTLPTRCWAAAADLPELLTCGSIACAR